MRGLVTVRIPNNTGGSSWNNAIGWADGVRVSILADSGNGQVSGGGYDVAEIPSERNELVLSNLEIRGRLLGRLGDGKKSSRG